jgi:hypothetical protein
MINRWHDGPRIPPKGWSVADLLNLTGDQLLARALDEPDKTIAGFLQDMVRAPDYRRNEIAGLIANIKTGERP